MFRLSGLGLSKLHPRPAKTARQSAMCRSVELRSRPGTRGARPPAILFCIAFVSIGCPAPCPSIDGVPGAIVDPRYVVGVISTAR
eukprot:2358476-Lingulodinium_polyedra.AAC.1